MLQRIPAACLSASYSAASIRFIRFCAPRPSTGAKTAGRNSARFHDIVGRAAGEVAWIPAGEKHWHGATETIGLTHIAIAEELYGKTVDWMEKISDAFYPFNSMR